MSQVKSNLPRVLVVTGLTASGKTDLALKIAESLPSVDIISADSRQFYQGLGIISGQDVPESFDRVLSKDVSFLNQPAVCFSSGNIHLWGVDQLSPDQILNLSDYTDFVWQIINRAASKNRPVIIVGGTGLYLKAITQPLDRLSTPPNPELRQKLEKLSLDQLQESLKKLDPDWLASLNHSDLHNPRRLIRAIEISSSKNETKDKQKQSRQAKFRFIGLNPQLDNLSTKVRNRVEKRLQQGVLKEIEKLLQKYPTGLPALSALGIKYIHQYLNQEIDRGELIDLWTKQELAYAKDQWVWFKKQPQIIWYDENTDRQKLITQMSAWLTANDTKEK